MKIVLPLIILSLAAYFWSRTWESNARSQMSDNVFTRILTANMATGDGKPNHPDSDGDLVADSPEDPQKCIDPEVLTISFVSGDSESGSEEAWKEVVAALKEKTGREVKYVAYESIDDQLAALGKGELHITGLNTGNVPVAVERDGFVPLCTFGHDDGSYGYTMQVLVPADSPIKDIADVKGHKITFTRPDSNSGCKALVMYLKQKLDLQPERDYACGFSASHEESIKGVASKQFEAAPVASDIFMRMVERNEVDVNAVRKVYESERFPPATIGYLYNLAPELRKTIRETLLNFDLRGTALEGEFGAAATKLVAVDYKKDWDNARRIDQFAVDVRSKRVD
jgi:phosphonate transport system substrate-binding protein